MGHSQGGFGYIPQVMPPLTNNSLIVVRQHMDDNNHGMVNMLTQQTGRVFNLLIQNIKDSYQ